MPPQFDVNAARQAGVSDEQILSYLAQRSPNFDLQGALKQSSQADVISYLATRSGAPTTAAKPDQFGEAIAAAPSITGFEGLETRPSVRPISTLEKLAGPAIAAPVMAMAGPGIVGTLGAMGMGATVGGMEGFGETGTAKGAGIGAGIGAIGALPVEKLLTRGVQLFGSKAALQEAGRRLGAVTDALSDVRIQPSQAMEAAQEMVTTGKLRGETVPMVVKNFVKAMTPSKAAPGPIAGQVFPEARQVYSGASGKLSAEEIMRLTPTMRRKLVGFARGLGQDLENAAAPKGMAAEYHDAMAAYHRAASDQEVLQWLKTEGVKLAGRGVIAGGIGTAAGYGIFRLLQDLR